MTPLRSSTLAWRKASPAPSDSSTNPKPRSGLNHLTTARTGGPEGVSNRRGGNAGSAEITEMWVIAVVVEIAAPALTKIPVSDQVSFLSNWFTAQSDRGT